MSEQPIPNEGGVQELRLFPLNTVLFPGMPMPLRIFEERYKLMIGECLETEEPFGVVLIREGLEVGGPALPYPTGTTARITQAEKLEDGRMNLSTVGERRFQIVDTIHETPYLKGNVRYLPEETGDMEEGLLTGAQTLFSEYIQGLSGLRGGWIRQPEVPDSPGPLSFSIAHYLELPALAKQRLLEVTVSGERLKYEVPLLEGATQRIRDELIKRSPYQGPRLN